VIEQVKIIHASKLYLLAVALVFIYSFTLWHSYLLIFQESPQMGGFQGGTSGFEGFKTFFAAMLIGPFFETFVFQYLIIMGLLQIRYFKSRIYIPIVISALCFSLTHDYSAYYIIYAFGAGLIFAIFFVVFMKRKEQPFLNTVILHSILNFLVFLTKLYYS
jgi:hypothetical protein